MSDRNAVFCLCWGLCVYAEVVHYSYRCKLDFPVWGKELWPDHFHQGKRISTKKRGKTAFSAWDSKKLRLVCVSQSYCLDTHPPVWVETGPACLDKPGSCLLALLVPWGSARPSLCVQGLKRSAGDSFWLGFFLLLFCLQGLQHLEQRHLHLLQAVLILISLRLICAAWLSSVFLVKGF